MAAIKNFGGVVSNTQPRRPSRKGPILEKGISWVANAQAGYDEN